MTEGNGRGITTLLTFTETHLLQSEQWEEPGVVVLKSLKYKSVQNLSQYTLCSLSTEVTIV